MPAPKLEPGETFAGYVIERHLGAGGMGDVYQVRHLELNKSFALKVLPAEVSHDPSFAARFKREMETISRLDHPNIVMATNGGTISGQVWFTMTFVPGSDAQRAMGEPPSGLAPSEVVRVVEEVGAAVDHAHRKGILHRDIKPANILLRSRGDGDIDGIYLTDFGIAKAVEDLRPITTDAQAPMTLDFASPEQIRGDILDGRTDVYSLGATMYALLTGHVPFPAETYAAKVLKHLDDPPPRPSLLVPQIPKAFDNVIVRAMAMEPNERYQTCQELGQAARQALTTLIGERANPRTVHTVLEKPSTPAAAAPHKEAPDRPKHRRVWLSVVVATIVLIAGVVAVWRANSDPDASIDSAGSQTALAVTRTTGPSAPSSQGSAVDSAAQPNGQDDVTGIEPAGPGVAQPLADVLDPAPQRLTGSVGGTTLASAPAYQLQPKNCPLGSRQVTVALNQSYDQVAGNVQLDDAAPPETRTRFLATAGDEILQDSVLSPTEGASFDLRVEGQATLLITLESLGQGSCDSGDYLVFVTSAIAYPTRS